ncbi:MAG: Crp/Fnr family transcriptional regulator [Pseudomonadota bacterium]
MPRLSDIDLFTDLSEDQNQLYGSRCVWKDYAENELVIDHHDDSTDVRFIISGKVRIIVRVSAGKEVILNEANAGDFFGEIAAIDGMTRSANVTSITRSRMCIMPRHVFMDVLEKVPSVNRQVMRRLTGLVRQLSIRLSEYSFLQAKHRLYAELLRLSSKRPGHEGQRSISPPPIQREIADRIASRREVVSREMKNLERESVIEKTRGALVILDPGELNRRIVDGWNN